MFNFVRFAQEHGVEYIESGHHHCVRGWVQTHCPFCAGGRSGYHMGFNLAKGYFNCWRCGILKKLDVVRALTNVTKDQGIRILRKFDDGTKVRKGRRIIARKRQTKPPPGIGPLSKKHRRFLRARGFDEEVEELWELQGTRHLSGDWNWRVVFPVKNETGRIVSWQGRTISENARPKYYGTPDEDCVEDPKSLVYGLNMVPGDSVMIVEGATDVWALGLGTCGTLGIDWKPSQANKLRKFENRFIIFDPDPAAQKRAKKLADWISLFPGNTEIISGLPSDPGGLSMEDRLAVRRELMNE